MKLKGIEFGNVFLASGSRNFFGIGWEQDVFFLWHPGFDFKNATLITKTMTVSERMPTDGSKGQGNGNMVIDPQTFETKNWLPDCINIDFIRDRMANAVGLTNPGAKDLFQRGVWQKREEPTILSVMCVRSGKRARLDEAKEYVDIAGPHMDGFNSVVAQEINETCPNTGHCSTELYYETIERLAIFQNLGIPLIVKLDVLATTGFIKELQSSRLCDAIDIPNSLPVYSRPDKVNWKKLEYLVGPIYKRYGACGYSGRENFELATEVIRDAREAGVTLPIIGGGASSREDIHAMKTAGADAIAIGRATKTRFWRVSSLIREGNEIFGR